MVEFGVVKVCLVKLCACSREIRSDVGLETKVLPKAH